MTVTPALIMLCLAAYLLGSVPFGYLFAKLFFGRDPRIEGSRNVGATNVARLCGLPCGIITLLCDALKGFVPVWLSLQLLMEPQAASLVGFCALIGHMYSVFLRFRGGKAVATTIGVFLALSFKCLVISAALCLAVIAVTRYVSLGSLTLAASLPVTLALTGRYDLLPAAILTALVIFYKHRENIHRLLSRQEKKLGHRD